MKPHSIVGPSLSCLCLNICVKRVSGWKTVKCHNIITPVASSNNVLQHNLLDSTLTGGSEGLEKSLSHLPNMGLMLMIWTKYRGTIHPTNLNGADLTIDQSSADKLYPMVDMSITLHKTTGKCYPLLV